MRRIDGLIPLEGNIKTCVNCNSSVRMLFEFLIIIKSLFMLPSQLQVCMMSISSSMHKDMRAIRISSNYVIGNMTNHELYVAAFAVPNSSNDLFLPNDLTSHSITISPSVDKR
jgi:vacuolar protein sorting-associated protein 13B